MNEDDPPLSTDLFFATDDKINGWERIAIMKNLTPTMGALEAFFQDIPSLRVIKGSSPTPPCRVASRGEG